MKLAWGAKVSPAFRARVVALCRNVGIDDPNWLMASIAFETGRTFSPSVKNPNSSATGLIQFMASTAAGLGTTVDALAKMTAEEQLDYVEKYFLPFKGRLKSVSDVYMAILWPRAIGAGEDEVIFPAGSQAYLANRGLDLDHDGAVTKGEAAMLVVNQWTAGVAPENLADVDTGEIETPSTQGKPMLPIILAGLIPSLIQSLIEGFAPQIKAGVEKVTGGSNPDLANQLNKTLLDMVKQLTGQSDPVIAVAAAKSDAQVMAQVQRQATVTLDQLAPALEAIDKLEKSAAADNLVSQDAASARARVDGYDLAPLLAWSAILIAVFCLLPLFIIMGIQTFFSGVHEPSTAMLTLIGPLIAMELALMPQVFAYRFGTSRQSASKDQILGDIAKGKGTGNGA